MVMSKASSGEAVAALWAVTDEGRQRLFSENAVEADAHIGPQVHGKACSVTFIPLSTYARGDEGIAPYDQNG